MALPTYIFKDEEYEIEYYVDVGGACYIECVTVKGFNITDVVSDGMFKYWEGLIEGSRSFNKDLED